MATFTGYGTNFTIADAPTPDTVLATELWGGRVHAIVDRFTAAKQYDAASLIYVGKMPKGAVPLFGMIQFTGSSTATLIIGHAGDTNALGAATALTTTPIQQIFPTTAAFMVPLTADRDIYITTATAAIVTAEVIEFCYLYAKD